MLGQIGIYRIEMGIETIEFFKLKNTLFQSETFKIPWT